MIGSGIGGLAGGFISEACGGSFEMGSMIGSIIGSIIGGRVYKSLSSPKTPTTKVYRSMSKAEYRSIKATGKFSTTPGAMESKWFATSRADAKKWMKLLSNEKILKIKVPDSILKTAYFVERLDDIGPAYCFLIDILNSIL
ncbi:MAG: hypothetical protein K2G50_01685 [Anaeroplasmataceae bacterium]|nr:hypothetical protein [Anaeroplasmataceae bacterium]